MTVVVYLIQNSADLQHARWKPPKRMQKPQKTTTIGAATNNTSLRSYPPFDGTGNRAIRAEATRTGSEKRPNKNDLIRNHRHIQRATAVVNQDTAAATRLAGRHAVDAERKNTTRWAAAVPRQQLTNSTNCTGGRPQLVDPCNTITVQTVTGRFTHSIPLRAKPTKQEYLSSSTVSHIYYVLYNKN